jgi:hypothetical protein
MTTDLKSFQDTLQHHRPARFLYYFSCTPDLERRLRQHVGGDGDYGRHYGMFMQADNRLRRPENLPRPDYSKYWHGQEFPPGTTIGETGVAAVPSGFYHFIGFIKLLSNIARDAHAFPPRSSFCAARTSARRTGFACGRPRRAAKTANSKPEGCSRKHPSP